MEIKEEEQLRLEVRELLLKRLKYLYKESIRFEQADPVNRENDEYYIELIENILEIETKLELEELRSLGQLQGALEDISALEHEFKETIKGLLKINGTLSCISECLCSKEFLDAIKSRE